MNDRASTLYDDLAVEPSADFEHTLRRRLDHELRRGRSRPFGRLVGMDADAPAVPPEQAAGLRHRRRRRRYAVAVAAIAVAAITVAVLVEDLGIHNSNEPTLSAPLPTIVPTTIPATVPSPTAEPLFTEDDIVAIKALLWDTDVDIPGYLHPLGSPQTVSLDGAIAATVPACRWFLPTVFESVARPAVTDDRRFTNADNRLLVLQYVTVLPSLDAAVAMIDDMRDPAFVGKCVPAYRASVPTTCCDANFMWTPVFDGDEIEPPTINVAADDVWVRQWIGSWNDDEELETDDPQQMMSVAIRVDRVVSLIDVSLSTADGTGDATIQDVERIAQRMAARAADAQLVS